MLVNRWFLPLASLAVLANGLAISPEVRKVEATSMSLDDRSVCGDLAGLAQSLWVNVPSDCSACIVACLGAKYTAGWTVSTVTLWRDIGICGVTCVFSSKCTTAQAGTWQAQQPRNFPVHSKREVDE